MRRYMGGEVYLCVSTLIIEVDNDAGRIPDGIDEMSGDHFATLSAYMRRDQTDQPCNDISAWWGLWVTKLHTPMRVQSNGAT